jgi:signal transduction histidine kinase
MPERPDYAALTLGQSRVLARLNAGESGLAALTDLLVTVQEALGARGASFAEYAPTGGRIIAATGACGWALGRPVDPANTRLSADTSAQLIPIEQLNDELATQLLGRGLRRMVGARVELGGLLVGTLHAFWRADDQEPGEEHYRVLSMLAAFAARLYGGEAGLPVHSDGPVVAALADGLAVVDRTGTVLLWNPAAERVTGLPAAEALHQQLPFPAPPPGQVLSHRLADGRWLKVTAGDLPGTAAHRVVTFRDTTDADRRRDDRDLFVAVTSHELRTPVTVIKGYADTLTNHWASLDEPGRREAVRVIGQRAGDLARLIDRLLSASSDAGEMGGCPPARFDLVDTLRCAARDLPTALRHRLVLDLPDGLPKAVGDRDSMATLLTELATNADKYSPTAAPVEVTADADERSVAFRVMDRGIGVRPEHVERAFDRFWQGESGSRRRYPGAGLGLYLVRRIVERQGGWVSLRPRDGGGTVAEVRLPRG